MFSVRLGSRYAAPAAAKLCLLFLSYLPRSKLRYVDLSFSGDRYNFDLKQFDIFSIILLMDVYTPLSSIAGRAKERCIRSLRCCNAFSNGGVNWDRCRASPPIDHSSIHHLAPSFELIFSILLPSLSHNHFFRFGYSMPYVVAI